MKGIYKLSMFILDSRPEEAPRVFGIHTLFSIMYSHYLIGPCACQRCRPFLLCKFSTSNSPSFACASRQISSWNWSPNETTDNHSLSTGRTVTPWHLWGLLCLLGFAMDGPEDQQSCYAILGVDPSSSTAEIRQVIGVVVFQKSMVFLVGTNSKYRLNQER